MAVDDAQWLDEASAVVLASAVRRLSSERVGLAFPSERLPGALAEELLDDRLVGLRVPALSHSS